VIIDGCYAANVRWKCFNRVLHLGRTFTWKKYFASIGLHSSGMVFLIGAIMTAYGVNDIGTILLIYGIVMVLLAPWLLKLLYNGKVWGAQPWFFGFEGHLDIECIERQIFGAGLGRMNWSAFGSPLSRNYVNAHGEYVGVDPITDPKIKAMVERGPTAGAGDQRVRLLMCCGLEYD
jgi:hypothetical protein